MTNGDLDTTDNSAARLMVIQSGWNTTCYQILNPGIRLWFSQDRESCLGYVQEGKVLVVAGAPVCKLAKLDQTVTEWEGWASKLGKSVCYFGAEHRLTSLLSSRPGYATVVLGAQPQWHPESFVSGVKSDRSLRAQLNRARNKGVSVSEWPAARAENNADLQRILVEWLATRGLPPLHFLVEFETLGNLRDRRVFVAVKEGLPVAFVTLCPVPARNGWLTEQFVHGKDAPNGTIELVLFEAIDAIRKDGFCYVTMGIVPLSSHGDVDARSNPWWLNFSAKFARRYGNSLYNFEGLNRFKSKFHPDAWESVVAISTESGFSIRSLYSIASAFTSGSPTIAVAAGILKAIRSR